MLKLMKYEFRRQLFSKGVIFGGLLTLVAAFLIFYWKGVVSGTAAVSALMALGAIVVLFFAPLEFMFTFDKDMNTKQGYMLFLVPQKSTTILEAKLLVSLLQTVVIYTVFFTVVPFCERLSEKKFGIASGYISEIVNDFVGSTSSVEETVGFWISFLLLWLFFVSLGLFVTAIPVQGKMASVLGLVGYFAAIFGVFFVLDIISDVLSAVKAPEMVYNIVEVVYMLGIDLALFFGTARLLDKKVSI